MSFAGYSKEAHRTQAAQARRQRDVLEPAKKASIDQQASELSERKKRPDYTSDILQNGPKTSSTSFSRLLSPLVRMRRKTGEGLR